MFKPTPLYKIIIVLSIIVIVILFVCFRFFFAMYGEPNHTFDTSWIMGKTADEIVERYGQPDIWTSTKFGYDIGPAQQWLYPNVNNYYYVKFNENGFADSTYVDIQPGG